MEHLSVRAGLKLLFASAIVACTPLVDVSLQMSMMVLAGVVMTMPT
jgi:hypothetical protein